MIDIWTNPITVGLVQVETVQDGMALRLSRTDNVALPADLAREVANHVAHLFAVKEDTRVDVSEEKPLSEMPPE
jgi:hypothetical protein